MTKDRDLDAIVAQMDGTEPYYVARLVGEVRALRAANARMEREFLARVAALEAWVMALGEAVLEVRAGAKDWRGDA
jgi:hypothetical protein